MTFPALSKSGEYIESTIICPTEIVHTLEKLGWHNPKEGLPHFVGEGQEARVWNLNKEGFTIRVPKDSGRCSLDKHIDKQDRMNQTNFFYAMLSGYTAGIIPGYLRVPHVWNDISANSGLPNGVIVMKTIRGRTLLYQVLKRELQEKNGGIFDENAIIGLNDREIIDRYFNGNIKMFIDMFAIDKLSELFGDSVGEAIRESLLFLERKGVEHGDLHMGNFMLSEDGNGTYNIYIIDFGKATFSQKSTPFIFNGRSYYLENFDSIWEDTGIPFVK